MRQRLGVWFDSIMDRASGWYKRRMAGTLLAIATLLCLVLEVDTLEIARSVWCAAQARTTPVALTDRPKEGHRPAETTSEPRKAPSEPQKESGTKSTQPAPKDPAPHPAAELAPPATAKEPARKLLSQLGDDRTLPDLTPPSRDSSLTFRQTVFHVAGLGLSALAVALAASFGFQMVNRFLNVRLCGPRPW